MKNDFLNHAMKNVLFPAAMASALWTTCSQQAYAEDLGMHTVQQTANVKGTVVDAMGEPIIGANVLVKGSANGVITDLDGNFTVTCSGKCTLVISYIGYQSQEIAVRDNKPPCASSSRKTTPCWKRWWS